MYLILTRCCDIGFPIILSCRVLCPVACQSNTVHVCFAPGKRPELSAEQAGHTCSKRYQVADNMQDISSGCSPRSAPNDTSRNYRKPNRSRALEAVPKRGLGSHIIWTEGMPALQHSSFHSKGIQTATPKTYFLQA